MTGNIEKARPAAGYSAPQSRLSALVVMLVSLTVSFAVAEFGLRFYIDHLTREARQEKDDGPLQEMPDSGRVYALRPGVGPPFNSNSFGFRGQDISIPKAPGVFRIVMLGDSITYGNGVAWDQTFSYALEVLLNADSGATRIEVLNLGVSGYNTHQELATLRELGLQFSPDLVVLNVCLNDSDPVKRLFGLALMNETRIAGWSDINIRTIVESSYLLTLLKARLTAAAQAFGGNLNPLNSPALFLDTRVRETAWGNMKAALRNIHQVTGGAGIPLVAVIYPYRSQVHLRPEQRVPQQDLLAFFSSIGVPALDIAPAYLDKPQDMFNDGYVHLSPYGHRVVADTLRTFLTDNGLLPTHAAPASSIADGD